MRLFGGAQRSADTYQHPRFTKKIRCYQRPSARPSYESVDRRKNQFDTLLLVTDSGAPMPKADRPSSTERTQAYRQRLRAAGDEEVLLKLPRETIALLDDLKECHGLRNRSQALLQLIEHGRAIAQQIT